MEIYKTKGNKIFFCDENNNLLEHNQTLENMAKETQFPLNIVEGMNERKIYDLLDGETFLKYVNDLYFTDYDGTISDVFVDGYKSNLGLSHKEICQGRFLVSGEKWKKICQTYKVEVNWANK